MRESLTGGVNNSNARAGGGKPVSDSAAISTPETALPAPGGIPKSTSFVGEATSAKTGADVELLYLERGLIVRAKPCDICQQLVNNMEEIYIVIDLKGIRVCSTSERSSAFLNFSIETILKYSHNKSKQTFSFTHMSSDGIINVYKFSSDDYIEIFQAIGTSITMIMKSKGETWNPEEKIVNKNRKSALMDLSPSTAVNNHKSYIEKPVENNTKNLNTKQLTAGESSTDTTHSIIDEKAITSTTQNPHSSNQIANPPSSSSNSKYTIGPPHSLNSAVENTASPDVRKAKLKPHGLLISSGKRESGEPGSPGGPLSSPKSAGPLNHQQQPPVPQSPKTADQDKKAGGGGFFSMFKKPKDDDTSDYVDPTSNNNTPQARKKSAFKETIAKFLPGSTAMNTEQSESWAALMVQKNAPSNDGNQGAPTSLQNSPASVSKSSGMLSMGRKKSTSVSTAGPPTDFNAPPVPAILSHPITGNTSAETPKSPAAEKSGGGIFSRKKANSTAGSNIPDMAKLVAETTSTNTANTTTSSASAATKSNFLGFHMRKKSLSSGAQDAPVPDSFIAAPPVPKLPAVVAAGPTDTISPTSPTLTDIQLKKLSMIGQGGRKTNYVVQSVDSLDTETSPVIKNEVFADGDLGTSNNKRQSSIRPKSVIVLSSKTNSEILLSISPSPPPQKSPVEHTSSSNESRRQNFSNLNEKRKKAFSTAALDEIDGLPSPTSPKGSVDALEISASNDITGKKGSILAIISGKKKATSAQEVQEANAAESQPVNEEKPRRRSCFSSKRNSMISAGDVFAASHEPMPSLPTWATAGSETQIKKRANNNNSAPILLSSELVKSSSNTSIDQTKLGTRPFLSSGSVNNDDTGSKAQVIKSILKHPSSSNNSSAESLHSVHSVHVANGSPELLKRSESIKSTKRSNSVKRDYYEMAESKPSKLSEGIVIPRNESNLSSQLEVGGSVSSERTSRIKQPSSPNPTHSPITTTGGGIDSNEQNLSASMGRKTKEQFRRLVASTSDLTDHSSGGSLVNHTQQQFHPLKNEVDRVSDASIQSLPPDGVIEMKAPIGGSLETGLKREGLEPSPDSKNDSSSIASVANASSEEEIISASMPALTASPQTLRDKKPRAKSALKNSLLGMLSSSDRSPVSSKSENKIDGGSSAGGGHKRHQSHNTLLRQSKPEPKSRSASEVPKPSSSEEVSSASLGSTMRRILKKPKKSEGIEDSQVVFNPLENSKPTYLFPESNDSLQQRRQSDLKEKLPEIESITDANNLIIMTKTSKDGKYQVSSGTIDELINVLLNETDLLYCDTFLLTFRHIISAKDLLEKMTSKFELLNIKLAGNQKENPNAIDEQMVMHRICSILKRWVATDPLDFLSIHSEEPETPQSPLNSASIDFMSSMKHSFWKLQTLIKNSEYSNYYDQIRGILDYEIQLSRYENAHTNYITHAKEGREEEVATMLMTFDIHRYASTEIAQQLTLVDSEMFRSIQPYEFAVFLFEKDNDSKMRRLNNFIDRFNKIGFWVSTVICSIEDRGKRTHVVEKFIKIAKQCLVYKSFNSAMAILSGLNTTSVSRLKKTFNGISGRIQTLYEELESKLSYEYNFKNYRELEQQSKPEIIPFFGLIIKDLTFMNDGNSKTLPNGLINFEKLRQIYVVIKSIKQCQSYKYPFQPDKTVKTKEQPCSLFDYCLNPPSLREEQLSYLSKMLEPPENASNHSLLSTSSSATSAGSTKRMSSTPLLSVPLSAGNMGQTGGGASTSISPSIISPNTQFPLSLSTCDLLNVIYGHYPGSKLPPVKIPQSMIKLAGPVPAASQSVSNRVTSMAVSATMFRKRFTGVIDIAAAGPSSSSPSAALASTSSNGSTIPSAVTGMTPSDIISVLDKAATMLEQKSIAPNAPSAQLTVADALEAAAAANPSSSSSRPTSLIPQSISAPQVPSNRSSYQKSQVSALINGAIISHSNGSNDNLSVSSSVHSLFDQFEGDAKSVRDSRLTGDPEDQEQPEHLATILMSSSMTSNTSIMMAGGTMLGTSIYTPGLLAHNIGSYQSSLNTNLITEEEDMRIPSAISEEAEDKK